MATTSIDISGPGDNIYVDGAGIFANLSGKTGFTFLGRPPKAVQTEAFQTALRARLQPDYLSGAKVWDSGVELVEAPDDHRVRAMKTGHTEMAAAKRDLGEYCFTDLYVGKMMSEKKHVDVSSANPQYYKYVHAVRYGRKTWITDATEHRNAMAELCDYRSFEPDTLYTLRKGKQKEANAEFVDVIDVSTASLSDDERPRVLSAMYRVSLRHSCWLRSRYAVNYQACLLTSTQMQR